MMRYLALGTMFLYSVIAPAQVSTAATAHDVMSHKADVKPSTQLVVTGLGGQFKTLSLSEFKALPHVAVTVHNGHSDRNESYSGVPVKELLAMVAPATGSAPKISQNMQVVIAGATDGFRVAIALCDIDPDCRNGQAIVADSESSSPLQADGAFKLILTEDKKPSRWARNLNSLTVMSLGNH